MKGDSIDWVIILVIVDILSGDILKGQHHQLKGMGEAVNGLVLIYSLLNHRTLAQITEPLGLCKCVRKSKVELLAVLGGDDSMDSLGNPT